MTIEREQIQLMEWLRRNGKIGAHCPRGAYVGKGKDHFPEQCAAEVADYVSWEHTLRSAGQTAESAYYLIRKAADSTWWDTHGEDSDAELASRVAAYRSGGTYVEWPGVGYTEYTLEQLLEGNTLVARQLRRRK